MPPNWLFSTNTDTCHALGIFAVRVSTLEVHQTYNNLNGGIAS